MSCFAAVVTVGCKKEGKTTEEPSATTATTEAPGTTPPAVETQEPRAADLSQAFRTCWEAYSAKDEATLASCYADDAEMMLVDFIPPMTAKGKDEAMTIIKRFWASSSDLKAEPQLVLRNDNNFASLLVVQGTNDGEMMGSSATQKPFSYYEAQVVSFNPEGQVIRDRHWIDQAVLAHQIGTRPSERAPDAVAPWSEQLWVVAADDESEKANIETVEGMTEAIKKGDIPAYMEHVADDVTFHYVSDKEPMEGKEAYQKGFEMWAQMADRKSERTDLWAAGDWVVAINDTTATLKMDMPGTKGTKGKEVKSTTVEFLQLEDGKLESHWVVENSLVYPVQLGLMDMATKAKTGKKPNAAK